MKGKNLYRLYQLYFGYESASSKRQKQNYAISIIEAVRILEQAHERKSVKPIEDYISKPKKRQLTSNFLDNFLHMFSEEFEVSFRDIKYIPSQITVAKEYLSNSRNDIVFACPYIEDNKNKRIIILTFSTPKNMLGELSVLKGLVNVFEIDRPFSSDIKSISYWDLSKGIIIEEDYIIIEAVPKKKLVEVLDRL